MNRGASIFAGGVILILLSVILFLFTLNQASNSAIAVEIEPGGMSNRTVMMKVNSTYIISMSSTGRVEYRIYTPHGSLIENGTISGKSRVRINTTEDGRYIVSVRNLEDEEVKVSIVALSEDDYRSMEERETISLVICVSGVVVVFAGILFGVKIRISP